jgi:class 3 adenylate cyclase
MSSDEKLLDDRLAALEGARAWSPRVVSKLESHIRSAPDEAVFRINPLVFAAEKNMSEAEAVDLFLHATALGIFEMNWLLLCPMCSGVVESFQALRGVRSHYHCFVCQADFEAKLDEFIAITFTVDRAIRDIKYHRPGELSARDYFFTYCTTSDGRLPDGTPFAKAAEAATRAVSHLPPGETTEMTIEAREGVVFGVSYQGGPGIVYAIEGAPAAEPQRVEVAYGEKAYEHTRGKIAPGRVTFAIRNITGERGTFAIAVFPPGFASSGKPLAFGPFLDGKRLLTTQTFRDLFRSEVIRTSEGIGVTAIALLFTDLKGSTALYNRIGDLNAFALVQQHFDRLQDLTVQHKGAIIKTIGDAVMAAFLVPADAVRAALAMRENISAFNKGRPDRELALKIGIHTGAAIAVTLNDRLDYFGQTVNIAARVQNLADADEIFVSEDVFEADGVRAELASLPVEPQRASLRGIHEDVRVFRIPPSAAAA